jgi:hypothetical protein
VARTRVAPVLVDALDSGTTDADAACIIRSFIFLVLVLVIVVIVVIVVVVVA